MDALLFFLAVDSSKSDELGVSAVFALVTVSLGRLFRESMTGMHQIFSTHSENQSKAYPGRLDPVLCVAHVALHRFLPTAS